MHGPAPWSGSYSPYTFITWHCFLQPPAHTYQLQDPPLQARLLLCHSRVTQLSLRHAKSKRSNHLTFLKLHFLFPKVRKSGNQETVVRIQPLELPRDMSPIRLAAVLIVISVLSVFKQAHHRGLTSLSCCRGAAVSCCVRPCRPGQAALLPVTVALLCAAVGVQAGLAKAPQFPDLCNVKGSHTGTHEQTHIRTCTLRLTYTQTQTRTYYTHT